MTLKVKVILKCKKLLHRTGPKAFRGVTPPLSKMKKKMTLTFDLNLVNLQLIPRPLGT